MRLQPHARHNADRVEMDKLDMKVIQEKIAPMFRIEGTLTEAVPYGSSHINDTVRLTCTLDNGRTKRYILQRMNHEIFKSPGADGEHHECNLLPQK